MKKRLNRSRCCLACGLGWAQVTMFCTLAPPGEYNRTAHVQPRCDLMSNYFDIWPLDVRAVIRRRELFVFENSTKMFGCFCDISRLRCWFPDVSRRIVFRFMPHHYHQHAAWWRRFANDYLPTAQAGPIKGKSLLFSQQIISKRANWSSFVRFQC